MASVTFDGVGKVFADGTRAVDNLNLEIADGDFMVLVGPSGCGKTTALRMVAGLEDVTEGEIRLGDTPVTNLDTSERDIAMVFQNYALYPHMTVFDNIAFPLRSRKMPKAEVRHRVKSTAELLGLEDLLKRRPRALSGGQRQRVAMGRAIVREPRAFLMDEPLSNLDAKLRSQMRAEIATLQRKLRTTTLYVTHDQIEAMTMGSRIAVMRKGVLQQQGRPRELFDYPANLFVGSFIGSPAMNLLHTSITVRAGRHVCEVGSQRIVLPTALLDRMPRLRDYDGKDLAVGIRPEHADVAKTSDTSACLRGEATLVEDLGSEQLVHVEVEGEAVVTDEILEIVSDADASMRQSLEREASVHRVNFVARSRNALGVDPGRSVELSIDVDRLHFFDLETGRSLHDR